MNLEDSTCRQIAQELKINQSAQCPYVVVCYQSIYDNGTISIILEYMDGGSLEDLLNKVITIPEPFLAAICKQVRKSGDFNVRFHVLRPYTLSLSCFGSDNVGAKGFDVSSP